MVTAPAPAVPGSQTQPPVAAGSLTNPALPQISFDSVLQNLPILPDATEAIASLQSPGSKASGPQLPATKDLVSKKDPSKRASEKLPATANLPAVPLDSVPQQPKLSSSLTLSPISEPSPVAQQAAPIAQTSTQDALTPDISTKLTVVSTLQQSAGYTAAAFTTPAPTPRQPESASTTSALLSTPQPLAVSQQQPVPGAEDQVDTPAPLPQSPKLPVSGQQSAKPEEPVTLRPNPSSIATTPAAEPPENSTPLRRAAVRQPAFDSQLTATAPTAIIGAPLNLAEEQKITSAAATASQEPAGDAAPHSATEPSPRVGVAPQLVSVDPPLISKDLQASLAPKNENLAFSLHMLDTTARRVQIATPAGASARTQPAAPAKNTERPLTSAQPAPPIRETPQTIDIAGAAKAPSAIWNDAAAAPQLNQHSTGMQFSEPQASVNPSSVAAMHEAQQLLPEPVKPNSTSEILLQLGGKDQPAAIRVSDRGGAVNVSVHAADPELRTSLRSSLGELASQLSHQGWKTDVVKSGTPVPRAETSQDFRQDGQRSPSQQQPSAHGERQPQRDRRANGGQWLAEFEEQSSGNSGNRGGTNS